MNAGKQTTAVTREEIYGQAEVCDETVGRSRERFESLAPLLPLNRYSDILMTGCGSSFNLASCASYAWSRMLARPVLAVEASELMHFPDRYLRKDARPLVIAVSRTGGTTEVTLAVESLRRAYQARSFAITSERGCLLSTACDAAIDLPECREQSVVMTGAFTCMLTATYLLADCIAGEARKSELLRIPELISRQMARSEAAARSIAEDTSVSQFFFLGSGPMNGLACESALKMTEMALEASSSYPMLEFRHGPKAVLDPSVQAIIFGTPEEKAYLDLVIGEIAAAGANVLLVSGKGMSKGTSLESDSTLPLEIAATMLPEFFLPAVYAHVGQLLAYWRAMARQANPDAPPHLSRTVTLNTGFHN